MPAGDRRVEPIRTCDVPLSAHDRGSIMADTPKLRDQAFDPEMIAIMGIAFDDVRGRLGLGPRDDLLAGYVARALLETAHRGARDAGSLADAVMQQLEDESVVGACGEGFVDAAHDRRPAAPATD
jgi:hypothetical protein